MRGEEREGGGGVLRQFSRQLNAGLGRSRAHSTVGLWVTSGVRERAGDGRVAIKFMTLPQGILAPRLPFTCFSA